MLTVISTTIVLLILSTGGANAAPLPSPVAPNALGVNIHFTGAPAKDLDMIRATGVGFVRMDLKWGYVEIVKGQYDFRAFDELVEACASRNIRVLAILDHGTRFHGEDAGEPSYVEGFAAFSAAAASRYRGKGVIFEVYNEPNVPENWWGGKPDAAAYMELVRKTRPAIRQADPTAVVIGPGVSCWYKNYDSYFAACLQRGLLDLVDAVSIHPYNAVSPEELPGVYAAARTMMQKHGGKVLPIVSSEAGYSTARMPNHSEQMQADYLARYYLVNLMSGTPLSIWYDWKNHNADPNNGDTTLGIINVDYTTKKAYAQMSLLMRNLKGKRFERRLPSAPADYVLAFSDRTDRPNPGRLDDRTGPCGDGAGKDRQPDFDSAVP